MLEKAKATVENDQAVVDSLKNETSRYSEQAQLSMDLQNQKLMEVNQTGAELQVAQANLEAELEKWKHKQEMKAMFNFFKAYAGMVVGIMTMQPEIAGMAEK